MSTDDDKQSPSIGEQPNDDVTDIKQKDIEDMAPLLVDGWKPSAEQRRTADHFGNTGDVFDLLQL